MLKIVFIHLSLLVALISTNVSALESVPEVYKDEYVTVRSGVMESGSQPINLGDRLTLAIEVDFRSNEVLVENLTEEVFRRNWGGEKGLVLTGPPEVTLINRGNGMTTLRGLYPFEVLDCPGGLVSCPGHKIYTLPVLSLGYQITDSSGQAVNNKSIRFNTWPGSLAVTQVLPVHHEGLGEFSEYFPDGAWSGSLAFTETHSNGVWLALIGGLLLLTSFMPALFTAGTQGRVESVSRRSGKRWENLFALAGDQGRACSDVEWADLIRRCAVAYCVDEHGFNPYNWLNAAEAEYPSSLRPFREYFIDLLEQEAVDASRRAGYTARFRELTGLQAPAGPQGIAA